MRRTIHATLLTLALLTPTALAQVTYLALEPHTSLEAAEAQAAALTNHPTSVITETTTVPGYESINLQQHTYRVLVGPLTGPTLAATRTELELDGHRVSVTTLEEAIETAYQVQIGAYRSDRLAADASNALALLGEPSFTQDAPPFTFVHAGPYSTRAAAENALERIHAAGITSRAALGTLTPEHQTAIDQRATPDATAEASPVNPAELPIALPEPAVEQLAITEPAPRELALEPSAVTAPLQAIAEPEVVAEVAPQEAPAPANTTQVEPAVASGADTAEDDALAEAATEEAGTEAATTSDVIVEATDLGAEVAEADAQGAAEAVVEEEVEEVVDLTLPVFIHVASGRTANHFDQPLTTLDELALAPVVHADNDTYRLYVGPMPLGEANELRGVLRARGIATFTTEHPSGETAALPQPEVIAEVTTEAPEERVTEAPAAATEEPTREAVDADAPTSGEEEPVASLDEVDESTKDEVVKEPAWEPALPILANRAALQAGTYLIANTSADLNDLREPHDTLTNENRELALMQAGDQIILLVGPIGEWQEDDVRAELRRKGMPAHTVHHPDHTPQSALIATATETATAPSNYLALTPHEPDADLTTELPNLLHVNGQALLGPIPNDELEPTAKLLTRLANVTFHPYPTAPAGADADDWAQHAYALLEYQEAEPARQAFLEARALDPMHYDALFGLAVTEDHLGNKDAAEFAYQYVMRAHPERFEARFNYALRTHQETDANSAIPHYQEALQLAADHPNNTRAQVHAALADALTSVNDHHGATEHYQAAYDLENDLNHLVARFKAQRASGHALDLLPELTTYELETRDARFTALIADIYSQAGQIAYAQDAIDRRMRDTLATPQEALLLNARAATHAAAGNHTQALTDLQTALELNPNDPTTRHNLGLTLLAQGQAEAALPHLQAAVQLGITDPLARLDIAEAAARAGDHELAAQHAHAAAQRLTDAPKRRALLIHAQAAQAVWDHAGSLPSLEELLQSTPNDASLLTMAGSAYYQTGQYARAAERLETAHNLTGDPAINAALTNAYLASQRYADAENALRATLAVTPDDPDALHKLGWALLHLGNHQGAQTAWADASALDHPQAKTDLANVFPQ